MHQPADDHFELVFAWIEHPAANRFRNIASIAIFGGNLRTQPACPQIAITGKRMKPDRRLFISTQNEMHVARQTCQTAPESQGKTRAFAHLQAAQAAFEDHNETGCLEECRAAFDALK